MDPLAVGTGTYAPTSASLPQIVSNTDMLMMPVLQDYSNRLSQLEDYNGMMNMNGTLFPLQQYNNNGGTQFNYEEYYTQMAENQARMSQYNIQQNMRYRRDNLIASAPMEKITNTAMILQEKIVQNEQEQIAGALANFLQSVREAYDPDGVADDETIMARAQNIYQQQTGRNLIADIRENGSGDFMHGFLNTALFGLFGQNTSAEDNISDITGQPKSTQAQKIETVGKVTGGVATGAATGALIGSIVPILGTGVGAVVGGVLGGIASCFA